MSGIIINPYAVSAPAGYTPVYTPPTITSANYMNWVEARHQTYSNGNAVSIAHDQSGNGHHWTQGTSGSQPQFVTNVLNSQPVFRFDGTDDFLALGSNIMSGKSAGEIWIIVKIDTDPPGASAQSGLWNLDGDGTNAVHYPHPDGTIYEAVMSTTRKTTAVNPTPALTSFRCYNIGSAASDYKIRIDGTEIFSTGSNTWAGFSGAACIGKSISLFGDIFLDGDVAGWCITDAVVNTTDRDAINGVWESVYGLTIA